jgi:diphthine synthase
MSVPCAIAQLLSLLEPAPASATSDSTPSAAPAPELLNPSTTLAISLSRVGDPSQKFVSGTLAELSQLDEDAFGGPLHSFVIVGNRFHALERDFAARWAVDAKTWGSVANGVYGVRD